MRGHQGGGDCTAAADCEIVNDGETSSCDVKPEWREPPRGGRGGVMLTNWSTSCTVQRGQLKKDKTACEAIGKNKDASERTITSPPRWRTAPHGRQGVPEFHVRP